MTSATVDSCSSPQSVGCSGVTSNGHSCTPLCTQDDGGLGTLIWFLAGINNCSSPSSSLGGARKEYRCKSL
jgi:hypothetical protein